MTKNVVATETVKREVDQKEKFLLAATIWAEARGEGILGMRAVAHVINNRTALPLSPGEKPGVEGVVKRRGQFTCWSPSDPNYRKLSAGYLRTLKPGTKDQRAWEQAQQIAEKVLSGQDYDPTYGAIFYHDMSVSPSWAKTRTRLRTIGGHKFYS